MEFYPKDDLDICIEDISVESEIQKIYSGAHVFITGATGFMGKILLEKILRSCNVGHVYLLMREKKGKTQKERLEELFNDVVFERMLFENRRARQKVTLMNGDFTLHDLGLSNDCQRVLRDEINFVFHVAATLNMNEPLRSAFQININGTRCLLEHAKNMTKLKTFVYVSTAYSMVSLNDIHEKFYPTEYSPEELEQLINGMNDAQLSAVTPLLIGKFTNTYSFTKAITEYMVSKYHLEIPLAVARPSIVISSAREPLVGWVDNINGATGVCAGATAGLLRVWNADPNAIADLIPVDVAINIMLAVGWHIAVQRPKSQNKIIYNLVSSNKKPITWQGYMDYNQNIGIEEKLALSSAVSCYSLTLIKDNTLFWIYTILFHVLPGFFIDVLMMLARFRPKFTDVYRKVYRANLKISAYCTKEFTYIDDNVDEVWNLMNDKDKHVFNFDLQSYTYEQYFRNSMRGMRVYLFKDSMNTLLTARKRYQLLKYIFYFTRGIMAVVGGWFASFLYHYF